MGVHPPIRNATTEKWVLLGRGNSVAFWPGNVRFRQIISSYRSFYLRAYRSEKVSVAMECLEAIEEDGSKFMQHIENGGWVPVTRERVLEKCCQALREKAVYKTSGGNSWPPWPPKSPENPKQSKQAASKKAKKPAPKKAKQQAKKAKATVVKPKIAKKARTKVLKLKRAAKTKPTAILKKTQLTLAPRPATKKSRRRRSMTSSILRFKIVPLMPDPAFSNTKMYFENNDGLVEEFTGWESSTNADQDQFATSAIPKLTDSPCNRALFAGEKKMLKKLGLFKERFGHCAVPPAWPPDRLLADWCSVQRLFWRMSKADEEEETSGGSGISKISGREDRRSKLTNQLDSMGFVWDFDEWHWERRCNRLIIEATQSKSAGPTSLQWLEDQKRLHSNVKSGLFPSRRRKLEAWGYQLGNSLPV